MQSKLQGWKAKLLSQTGRTSLISSTFQSMPLYTFSCFKVPETVCNKMDALSRAFLWGHDPTDRKMHMVSWEKICKPKRDGGLGLKKFGLMNQAMLARQYWRISQHPQTLVSRAFKAKYFPKNSMHDCSPKPHHSWFWRSILSPKNKKLKEGRWVVGTGAEIPLNHNAWYPCQNHVLKHHNLHRGSVAELIDNNTHTWKPNLIQALYPPPFRNEILQIPLSRTGSASDNLVWKHSISGEFQVKKAYELLLKDEADRNSIGNHKWHLVWKVQVPLKNCNFVWRLLHDSLPTYLTLKRRGIPIDSSCPMCEGGDESSSHLFLSCPFARAIWYAFSLALHTSDFHGLTVQQWVGKLLHQHKNMSEDSMCFLQTVFTTLWTIWTHRNLVIHEGKQPNPLDVILTSQSLLCRYKEAFGCLSSSSHCSLSKHRVDSKVGGPWQLIIKVAAAREKRHNRTGLAYEAKSIQGVVVVQGITSSTGKLISIAIQEAMIEEAVKARSLGFNHFLFLCGSREL